MGNSKQIRIAMCGKARSGKDYFAENLAEQLRGEGKSVVKIAFADALKSIYREYFGKVKTTSKPRDAYLAIGNTFRDIYPNVWVDALAGQLEFLYQWDVVIITDLRFPNEEEFCKANGFTIIKTWASDQKRTERSQELGEFLDLDNDGDIHVENIHPNFIIDTTNDPIFEDVYKDLITIGWRV